MAIMMTINKKDNYDKDEHGDDDDGGLPLFWIQAHIAKSMQRHAYTP